MSIPRLPLPDECPLEVFVSESIHIEDLLRSLFIDIGGLSETEDIEAIVSLTDDLESSGDCIAMYDWIISATSGNSHNVSEIELNFDDSEDPQYIVTANAHYAAYILLLSVRNILFSEQVRAATEDTIVSVVTNNLSQLSYELSGVRFDKREMLRLISIISRERACVVDQYYDCIDMEDETATSNDLELENLTVKKIAEMLGYGEGSIRKYIRELNIDKNGKYYTKHGLLQIAEHILGSKGFAAIPRGKARKIIDRITGQGIE